VSDFLQNLLKSGVWRAAHGSIRIQEGEPNKVNVTRAARCQIAQQAAFGAAKKPPAILLD